METHHIGELRLQRLALANASPTSEETFHLLLCDSCLATFTVFVRFADELDKGEEMDNEPRKGERF